MTKEFSQLEVGQQFVLNGETFTKVAAKKISCCKSINAHRTNDASKRVFVPPKTMVEVND